MDFIREQLQNIFIIIMITGRNKPRERNLPNYTGLLERTPRKHKLKTITNFYFQCYKTQGFFLTDEVLLNT